MKRKMAWIGIFYLIGLFSASFFNIKQNIIIAVSVFLIALILFLMLKSERALILIVSLPVITAVAANVIFTQFHYNKIIFYDNKAVSFSGKISDISEKPSDKVLITVKGKINGKTNAKIIVYADMAEMDYGDALSFSGTMQKIENSVSFSSEDYYKPKGIYLNCFDAENIKVTEKSFSLKRNIMHYRDFLFDEINRILPGEEGAFIGAMLCGDKSEMSGSVKLSLYRTGIGHIFAVSGTHLVIITSVILAALNMLNIRRKARFAVLEIFIAVFIVFSGASASVLRAGLMLSVIYISDLFKRKPDTLNTLGLCAVLLTAFNPYLIRNISFLLSMSGAFSIGVVSPVVIRVFNFKGRFISLKKNIVTLVALSVCMFPVSVFCFNEVSLISPVANLLLIPICSFALVLAVMVAFTGGLSFFANPLLTAAGLCVKLVLYISYLFNKIPFSYISTGNSVLKSLLLIAVLVSAAFIFKYRSSIKKAFLPVIMSLVLVAVGTAASSAVEKGTLHLLILSDKVSNALLLYKGGSAVIIDLYGSGNMSEAFEKYIELYGIKSVKALFISSRNADNVYSKYKASVYTSIEKAFRTSEGNESEEISYLPENSHIDTNGCEITVLKNGGYLIDYGGVTLECADTIESSLFDTNIKILYDDNRLIYKGYDVSLTENGDSVYNISLRESSDFSVRRLW